MAHNDTRGSAQRLSEKRIRQATARASSVSETSDHSSQDRVRALEQQLRAAEQREHDTQRHHQLQLQEKDRELSRKNREVATNNRQLIKAKRRHGDAEERAQLAEQREQAAQLLLQLKERELASLDPQETLPGQNTPFLLMCYTCQYTTLSVWFLVYNYKVQVLLVHLSLVPSTIDCHHLVCVH